MPTIIESPAGAISPPALDPQLLKAVTDAAVRRQYDAGEIVFLEGEPPAGLQAKRDA